MGLFADKSSKMVHRLNEEASILRHYTYIHILKYEGVYEEMGTQRQLCFSQMYVPAEISTRSSTTRPVACHLIRFYE